jgi:hypothetical protein
MADLIVKSERFVSAFHDVQLVTIQQNIPVRYFSIIKDGVPVYTSQGFYGATHDMNDAIRNCDAALQVVRQLLTETGFLIGEVVGA